MSALAPDLAGSEIDSGNTTRRDLRSGERPGHAVDEYRARGEFRSLEGGAGHRIVADVELHRNVGAPRVVEAVWTQAETAGREIERYALRLGTIVAAGVEAQVSAADQAVEVLGKCGSRKTQAGKSEEGCKRE